MNQFNLFKQNPVQFLAGKGLNIPSQYQNDPRGMVQNLLNSGKMSQDQFNKIKNMANQMGINLD